MKKIVYAIAAGSVAVSCSSDPAQFSSGENDESPGQSQEELDVTKPHSLTRKNIAGSDETARRTDSTNYYNSVGTTLTGQGPSISSALNTLAKFRARYAFGAGEQITYYYNRGDLGIGREMHCMDRLVANTEIACYVVNFAAGVDGTQFIFGQSPQNAFNNMNANHSFATVAMVYRDAVAANNNKIFFVVYDAAGNLQNFAALDRTAAQYLFGADQTSVPGTNWNMHVPTNCLNCHGGASQYSALKTTNALFLPFDLDQFDYQAVSGKTRADQLTPFKHMNEMVWKVAARSGADCSTPPCTTGPLVKQLDGWYGNASSHQSDTKNEVLEGNFNAGFIPSGWNGSANARTLYTKVIRPLCRNCHVTNSGRPFDTEAQFQALQSAVVSDICGVAMPHALQTWRLLYQTGAQWALGTYLKANGQTTLANQLAACGPGNVANVDAPLVGSASSVMW